MKLYDCQMAPNPRRARIFIAEKGLDIPKQEVNIIKGENLREDYLRVNPWGMLPSLELDDDAVGAGAGSNDRLYCAALAYPGACGLDDRALAFHEQRCDARCVGRLDRELGGGIGKGGRPTDT